MTWRPREARVLGACAVLSCAAVGSSVFTCNHREVFAISSTSSRTFKSGNSEAVRLPKAVAYGAEIEVTIIRSGDVLTIYPARPPIATLAQRLADLDRPARIEVRDQDPLPEPTGL